MIEDDHGDDGDHGERRQKGQKRTVDAQYQQLFSQFIENFDDWDRLYKELVLYTVRKHGPRAERHGRSAEDYVQGAIAAALGMRRLYDFEGNKTFKQFLMSAIDSDISHQHARPIHRTVRLESRADFGEDEVLSGYDVDRLVSDDRPDRVIDKIDAERENRALPPDLRRLHELNQSTKYTAREKAQLLGVTESDVRNMQRRLDRHFKRKRNTQGI